MLDYIWVWTMTSVRRAGINHQSRNVLLNQRPTFLFVSCHHEDHSAVKAATKTRFLAPSRMTCHPERKRGADLYLRPCCPVPTGSRDNRHDGFAFPRPWRRICPPVVPSDRMARVKDQPSPSSSRSRCRNSKILLAQGKEGGKRRSKANRSHEINDLT
jgi:hypothetical protein